MLEGQVAIVTGGASGIGKALARRFAAEGAKVVVADLDASAASSVAQSIGGMGVACDVCDEDAIKALVSEVREAFGEIDLFCSNAGLALGQPDHAASASNEDWALNWNIHVMAHVYAARAVLPAMIARKSGRFVNVSSAAGLLNQIGDAAYSATKHAAVSFAESLAITHADDGISVHAVCPQYVATPLLDMDETAQTSDTLLSPDDVAEAVIRGIRNDSFLILPHKAVSEYTALRATDPDKWLGGMRGLRRWFLRDSETGDLREMHKFI